MAEWGFMDEQERYNTYYKIIICVNCERSATHYIKRGMSIQEYKSSWKCEGCGCLISGNKEKKECDSRNPISDCKCERPEGHPSVHYFVNPVNMVAAFWDNISAWSTNRARNDNKNKIKKKNS